MCIKINKLSPVTIIKLQIAFALVERFLTQSLKLPGAIIYGMDFFNLLLLLCLLKVGKRNKYIGFILAYIGITAVLLITGFTNFKKWGGNFATAIVEIRNIVRFPIFFLACAKFLNIDQVKKIYKLLTLFFIVNTIVILYQYFTFHPPGIWMRGDMLNGLFGTETGGNTFVNVILVVVVTYLLTTWSKKEISTSRFFCAVGASLLISALIELKAFFLEFVAIYGFYFIKKKKTKKESFLNVILIIAAVIVSTAGLQIMYREYPWFKNSISITGIINQLSGSGYTGEGDLNRFTGIFTIASQFFKGNINEILFGTGAGNASQSGILGGQSLFYNHYAESHYNWFSATYMFAQGGAFSLLLYLFTFVYLFFKQKQNKRFRLNTQIMCMVAAFLVFYGEALRTDAGYFVYFALASGFVNFGADDKISKYEV